MGDLVDVCYDDRFDVWIVDLYAWDEETEMHLHQFEEGRYGEEGQAEAAAEALARAERALLRVENVDGSVREERRPM